MLKNRLKKDNGLFIFNLQFFAEGDGEGAQDPKPAEPKESEKKDEPQDKPKEPKERVTFTKEQQEEVNRIVASRLATEKAKAEAEKEEAKKLAKMNADEKAQFELDKKTRELAEKEAAINRRELTAEAKDMLADKGLDRELHTLLNYESAETVKQSVEILEKAVQKAVEKAVEERLKGNPPKSGGGENKPLTGFDAVNARYQKFKK